MRSISTDSVFRRVCNYMGRRTIPMIRIVARLYFTNIQPTRQLMSQFFRSRARVTGVSRGMRVFSTRHRIKHPSSFGVTQTCFVIGFPLGLVDFTIPSYVLPIYKTVNIASEPHVDFQGRPIVIIDVTTRHGMSGSPVIAGREYFGRQLYRFLGIYTGRYPAADRFEDPALGIIYKPKVIGEIFRSRNLGN